MRVINQDMYMTEHDFMTLFMVDTKQIIPAVCPNHVIVKWIMWCKSCECKLVAKWPEM